jgi:transcriptional regulator with XRE-family HTH domain
MTKFTEALQAARGGEKYWLSRVKFDLASKFQDLLEESGLKQGELAEKMGVKAPQVSRALNGSSNLTLESIVRMGWALGYVPHVTFTPVKQVVSREQHTVHSNATLEIALTRAVISPNRYRFDVPGIPESHGEWRIKAVNDQKFAMAA